MGEATSPAPIPTSPVEAPACFADHLSFREKLVRRQAEKKQALFRYLDECPCWRILLSCCGPWRHSVVRTSPMGSVDPSVAFLLGGGLHACLLRIVGVFPCRVVPLSISGYCFSLGSGDRDRDLSRAPASVDSLAIGDSRPVFPGDEGSQHGHEMGSRIHPAERPDPSGMILEEVSSRCLCPASLVARPTVSSWRDPCGVEDEVLARSLSSEQVPLCRTLSETMRSGRYRSLGGPSRDSWSASSAPIAIRQTS
ncbi:hypothetical protein DY000_02021627 [Brassica cretica]|uniref:Uncharacterized protein n=1 Tax=Brassica cretica TaxID=69181 RepID=A0ABQ7EN09_BRACR|nr:hypothetical protein DY000_02021627 [Brassica cretica]